MLPATQTFDIGADDGHVIIPATPPRLPSSKKSSSKKRPRTVDDDPLLVVSQNILQKMSASTSSSAASTDQSGNTASRKEIETAQAAKALSDHADVLKKQLRELEEEEFAGVKALLTSSLTNVLKKLSALTD